ncbi:hypothetical protein ZIOFF_020276 [Zingiber officinale]|uniref:Uncharacterized protein n=1 Tax=Zingiber officinale TaxID=94328 RepID=A0A8J5L7V6_ZINOF|nr:hypothetical protein ZIOFF_020276 [Zingiber officinale]
MQTCGRFKSLPSTRFLLTGNLFFVPLAPPASDSAPVVVGCRRSCGLGFRGIGLFPTGVCSIFFLLIHGIVDSATAIRMKVMNFPRQDFLSDFGEFYVCSVTEMESNDYSDLLFGISDLLRTVHQV